MTGSTPPTSTKKRAKPRNPSTRKQSLKNLSPPKDGQAHQATKSPQHAAANGTGTFMASSAVMVRSLQRSFGSAV